MDLLHHSHAPFQAIAADCKRVTVLKYFLEALCGQEEPLLAFKGGKYISMATPPSPRESSENKTRTQELVQQSSGHFCFTSQFDYVFPENAELVFPETRLMVCGSVSEPSNANSVAFLGG